MKRNSLLILSRQGLVLLLLSLATLLTACGTSDSDESVSVKKRYMDPVFSQVKRTMNVVYGRSVEQSLGSYTGTTKTHMLDVYEPDGDTASSRPLILYAHGGSFQEGDKNEAASDVASGDDKNGIGEYFAKRGYVVASINYRLIPVGVLGQLISTESSVQTRKAKVMIRATIDGMSDMRGAIRYLLANSSTNTTKKYRIDKENIFVGGYSAGAFTAINVGYFNSTDTLPKTIETIAGTSVENDFVANYLSTKGGIEGDNDSHKDISTVNLVRGVLNIAGAIATTGAINVGEPAIYSVYDHSDTRAPPRKGNSDGSGVLTYGSVFIDQQAKSQNIKSQSLVLTGVGHDVFNDCDAVPSPVCDSIKEGLRDFIYDTLK